MLVLRSAGDEVADRQAFPPTLHDVLDRDVLLEFLACRLAPRPVVRPLLLHLRAGEDQRPCSLGIRRGEQHRHRPALGHAEQDGTFDSGVVHDRADVVHAFLERPDPDAVGQPHATLVEQDQAREARQSLRETAKKGLLPVHLQVGEPTHHQDEVERA